MERVTLHWTPLRSIHDFGITDTKATPIPIPGLDLLTSSGVCIWGFEIDGEFIPFYVGKSSRLNERALQHYARLRGGEYLIFHSSSVGSIRERRGEAPDPEGKGLLYAPVSLHALATQFLHSRVQEQLAILLEAFRITFGISRPPCDLGKVERGIADICGRKHLGSMVAMGDARYELMHTGDDMVAAMLNERPTDERGPLRFRRPS